MITRPSRNIWVDKRQPIGTYMDHFYSNVKGKFAKCSRESDSSLFAGWFWRAGFEQFKHGFNDCRIELADRSGEAVG